MRVWHIYLLQNFFDVGERFHTHGMVDNCRCLHRYKYTHSIILQVYTSIRQVHRYMYINQVVDVYSVVTTHDSDKKTVIATPNAV